MKCPKCHADADGRFCSNCGTPLDGAKCTSCRATLSPGARFCTQCGEAVHARGRSGSLPWIIAAAAMMIAIAAILLPSVGETPASAGAPFAGNAGGSGGAPMGTPPPLTGTPREQADRLFNRIMTERSGGNEEQARFFVPMAVQAYQASEPLDLDGLYHLSLVQAVGGDFASARATAMRILQQSPNHLLGLAALAEASLGAGDSAAAREAYQGFLDHLTEERGRDLPEYRDHAPILGQYEQEARATLAR
jgi:Double zinc ribbon